MPTGINLEKDSTRLHVGLLWVAGLLSFVIVELQLAKEFTGASETRVQHARFKGGCEGYFDFKEPVEVTSDLHLLVKETSGLEVGGFEIDGVNPLNT